MTEQKPSPNEMPIPPPRRDDSARAEPAIKRNRRHKGRRPTVEQELQEEEAEEKGRVPFPDAL